MSDRDQAAMAEAERHYVAFDDIQKFALRVGDSMFVWRIGESWSGPREVEVLVEGELRRYEEAMARALALLVAKVPDLAEADAVDAELHDVVKCNVHPFLMRWSFWMSELRLQASRGGA